MKRKLLPLTFAGLFTLSGCSLTNDSVQTAGIPVVVDPTPDTCNIYLVKNGKPTLVIRKEEVCLSSQEAMQQLLLGPEPDEPGYTSDLPELHSEFPRVHYAFHNNRKTTMLLPIPLGPVSNTGMQQISCTLSKTHDGMNLEVEGKDGTTKQVEPCKF